MVRIRRNSRGEGDLLVGLPLVMAADLDLHFLVKPPQKIEQLVRSESAEVPVHQVRNIRLRNPENTGDFALFQFLAFKNLEDMDANLRARIKLAGILQPQIGKNIAGAFLILNWFSPFRAQVLQKRSQQYIVNIL